MIDKAVLAEQRLEVERMRLEAERLEASNALRRAQLEAVRLGLRRECREGCGTEISQTNRTGRCVRCCKKLWQRAHREALRPVGAA